MKRNIPGRMIQSLLILIMVLAAGRHTNAEDWPTYRHDNRRSGVTTETLHVPLTEAWVYSSPAPPVPAWPGPAKWDAYARIDHLTSMRNFDPVFHVTVAGDNVFFGSSVDDGVHCLDAQSGREKWWYCTDGPVRLPPTCYINRIYFGSDDGHVYCLELTARELLWKYHPGPDNRRVQNNGKFISLWPCRTGVIVRDDIACFGHSLLPWRESYLCAVNADTGMIDPGQPGTYKMRHDHLTMQGAMLASQTRLYITQGRQQPIICGLQDGRILGTVGKSGDGGVFALITDDDTLFHGRGQNHGPFGELRAFDGQSRDYIAKFPKATNLVVADNIAYMTGLDEIAAFDRGKYMNIQRDIANAAKQGEAVKAKVKTMDENDPAREQLLQELDRINFENNRLQALLPECYLWQKPNSHHHVLIMAGNVLFQGGSNSVTARRIDDGSQIWRANVEGQVHGLAAANNALYVSTDAGRIYCFR